MPSAMTLLLIGVAVFAALAHICAGPLHAHAGGATAHEEQHSEHDDGDSAHGASCEALKTATTIPVPLVASCITAIRVADAVGRSAPAFVSAPVTTPSPPLFLLHAAFLI
jgi:hypothetical protein